MNLEERHWERLLADIQGRQVVISLREDFVSRLDDLRKDNAVGDAQPPRAEADDW